MRALITIAALTLAAPASAQVVLKPGYGMTFRIEAAGATPGASYPAKLGPNDHILIDRVRGTDAAGQMIPTPAPRPSGPLPPVKADLVELSFATLDGPRGKETVLILTNGYRATMVYRARITVNGVSRETGFCRVASGKRQYELWPNAIDQVELIDIKLTKSAPGEQVRCE